MGFSEVSVNKAHAVLFNEGPGYIFVESIQEGNNGQTSIVRSIANGQLYIRKKFPEHEPESNETAFHELLPESVAPRLCNGGNFAEFIFKYAEVEKDFAPRAIFWEFTRQLLNILAYLHSGWSPDGKIQEIQHTDCHEANILLQWSPTKTSKFPRFVLGDWARAELVTDDYTSQLDTNWYDEEYGEIQALYDIIIALNQARPDLQDNTLNDSPIWHFRKIWDTLDQERCLKLHQNTPGFSIAKYIAERYNPMADERLSKLPAVDKRDVRWTKPDTPLGFVRLGGGNETCEQSIAKWLEEATRLETEGKVPSFVGPWEWIPVDELPLGIVAQRVPVPCPHLVCPSEAVPTAMYSAAAALHQSGPGRE